VVGDERVNAQTEPTMGAEDFAFMLQAKPGCYVFIGNGEGDHRDAGHGLGPVICIIPVTTSMMICCPSARLTGSGWQKPT
jgi:metal-dependent amidase/aminoacylase/carboxypeptidase family protein